jgi:CBS domain-containing protein
VPVVREGKVVGIISRANIVRAVGATKGAPSREGEGDDRSIRARLLAELGREEWAQVWSEDIIVRDGIVHFWISADEPTEKRQALRVAAETIAGVRGVEEHLVPAPMIPAF